MVKVQRKTEEGTGVYEGVAGKRQLRMVSSWWAFTLSLCRGLGGGTQESRGMKW